MSDSALALVADPEIDGYSRAPAAVCCQVFDLPVEQLAHGSGTPVRTDVDLQILLLASLYRAPLIPGGRRRWHGQEIRIAGVLDPGLNGLTRQPTPPNPSGVAVFPERLRVVPALRLVPEKRKAV